MEIWRTVENWEFYQVSTHGRVRSVDRVIQTKRGPRYLRGKLLSGKNTGSYPAVTLSIEMRQQTYRVHTLVALAFLGLPPPGTEVCHRDGDQKNPRLENLRYGTPWSNSQDKYVHGTIERMQGENHHNVKLTKEQVLEARALRGIETLGSIAARFGVGLMAISRAQRRVSWRHVT